MDSKDLNNYWYGAIVMLSVFLTAFVNTKFYYFFIFIFILLLLLSFFCLVFHNNFF